MTPSTVSRQLGTLAASGLVERVDATGRYRLGIRLVHLANAVLARLDVREVARPHLVALVEATGETATLSVPGDEDAITVDFVPGSHQIQPVSRLGRPSIAHATSAGKVMLAFSGRELPDGPFRAYTTRTITDRAGARHRDRGGARARLRTGGRRARARAHRDRRADPLGARRARGDRRAPGPERALRRRPPWMPRSRSCSSVRPSSRASSAGAPSERVRNRRSLGREREPVGERADARAELVGTADREAAARAREDARGPVERADADPQQRSRRPPRSARRASRGRAVRLRRAAGRAAPPPPSATACARATSRRRRPRRIRRAARPPSPRPEPAAGSGRPGTCAGRRGRGRDAARYQRPVCTTRPSGLSSRSVSSPAYERYVMRSRRRRRIASARSSTSLAADGRRAARGRREVERLLERLDPAAQAVREHAMDLRERAVDRLGGAREAEPSRGERSERDDDGLVVREHERRKPVAGTDPIAAADAALALDRDAEILERGDVAPRRPPVDPEPVGDLATRDERLRLQQLEQLEQPGGRREHARSEAQIEGRDRPICAIASRDSTRARGATDEQRTCESGRRRTTSTSGWGAGTCATGGSCERLAGSDEWDEFDVEGRGAAAAGRARQRGRVLHRVRRRVRRHVVPLLRPGDRAVVDLLGRQPAPGPARPAGDRIVLGRHGRLRGRRHASTGRPIRVRFTWSRVTTPTPRWEQAFSDDDGETWETNWVMDFTPAGDGRERARAAVAATASRPGTGTSRRSQRRSRASCSATRSSSGTTSRRTTTPVPLAIRALARRCLRDARKAGTLGVEDGLGFVILHRCGDDFYFLLVSTWRNENELWETVWAKCGDGRRLLPPVAERRDAPPDVLRVGARRGRARARGVDAIPPLRRATRRPGGPTSATRTPAPSE